MKFEDWFNKRLTVGAFPFKVNEKFAPSEYDIVINVSDEYYADIDMIIRENFKLSYWFPMNECRKDIGLNSIYAAMVIMFAAEKKNRSVYLHCHAGVNRSHTVRAAYYYMRTGKHVESTASIGFINKLVANCTRGYLPPKAEMEAFLLSIQRFLDAEGMQGGTLDNCKIDHINNF